jgi:hypothetical protein
MRGLQKLLAMWAARIVGAFLEFSGGIPVTGSGVFVTLVCAEKFLFDLGTLCQYEDLGDIKNRGYLVLVTFCCVSEGSSLCAGRSVLADS